jgi:hypothetical protein
MSSSIGRHKRHHDNGGLTIFQGITVERGQDPGSSERIDPDRLAAIHRALATPQLYYSDVDANQSK